MHKIATDVRSGMQIDFDQESTIDLLKLLDENESGAVNIQYDEPEWEDAVKAVSDMIDVIKSRADLLAAVSSYEHNYLQEQGQRREIAKYFGLFS